MSMTVITLIAIVLYTIFNLYVGLGKAYTEDQVSTARGYFIGNGTGLFVLFFTTAATWFSAWIYMGAPAMIFNNGIGWCAAMTWQVLIIYLMGHYGPKFWRLSKDHGYVTPSEMIGDYFKSKNIKIITSVGLLVFCIPYLLSNLSGMGTAVATITGGVIPYWAGVSYAAILVGIYVFFGGFKSQAWCDTAQGIMFTIILWVSVFIMYYNSGIGGFQGMFDSLLNSAKRNLVFYNNAGGWPASKYFSYFIVQAVGGFFAPYVWQRMYAAKSGNTVKKMAMYISFFYVVAIGFPVILVGMGGAGLIPNLANPDSILVTTMAKYAPLWGVMVVVGIIAAGMSTVSSILVTTSSLVTIDLIQTVKPNLSTKQVRDYGRIVVLCMLVLCVISAFNGISGVAVLVNTALAGFCQMLIPVLGIFAWKRATKAGVLTGFVAGILVTLVIALNGTWLYGFVCGVWGLLVNAVVCVIVSLFTEPISEEDRNKFLEPLLKRAKLNKTA